METALLATLYLTHPYLTRDPEEYLTPIRGRVRPYLNEPDECEPLHEYGPHVEINTFLSTPQRNTGLAMVTPGATDNHPRTSSSWGDTFTDSHPHCRIVLQNINGLRGKCEMLGFRTAELQIDILGLVETNTDWDLDNSRSTTITSKGPSSPSQTPVYILTWHSNREEQ